MGNGRSEEAMACASETIRVAAGAHRTLVLAAAIAVLSALPFLPLGVHGDFINLDDSEYVFANSNVTRGLSAAGVRWALTAFHSNNWHPLTWLSHMLDVSLFGLDARGHHATSIILHALNAALLFLALRRLTGATGRSALVAAVFGVHPLHVESVAWIAERKDVLAGLFFMLVLLAYERYCRREGPLRYLEVLALFAVGLTAKSMLVTLPFVLLLLDFWPLGRLRFGRGGPGRRSEWGALFLEKMPLFLLAAASSVITILAQREGGAMKHLDTWSIGARFANAVVSYAAYLHSTVWPARLAVYYPRETIPWHTVAAAVVFLAVLSLVSLRRLDKRPFLAVGWCWFLGMFVPVIGLVQVGDQARADRYTYLPLIGLILSVVWLAVKGASALLHRLPALGLTATLLVVLMATAAAQARYWRDSGTLFPRALAVTKDNRMIETNFATWLMEKGRPMEAMAHAREALRICPECPDASYNLGVSLAALGRREEAIASYHEALRIKPDFVEAYFNLGASLAALGRREEAIASYRESLRLRPEYFHALYNLGNSLAASSRLTEAVVSYREALRIKPDFAEAHNNLGNALAALGRRKEAIASYREALRIKPDFANANINLSNAERQPGR